MMLDAVSSTFVAYPLSYFSPTQPQWQWIEMGSPIDPEADGRPCLWLGANQIGKSIAQAAKLLHFLRKTGPYQNRKPGPVDVCIVSISKEQIIPLMSKIWDMLPKSTNERGELYPIEAPHARFEPGFGFRGKPPRIVFRSGPAKGSIVTFATYSQGSSRIAGSTLDVLMLDEPPPESLWGEVVLRMLRKQGAIWITMTITPSSPPQEWLQEKVDAGIVRFMRTPLTVKNVTPHGMPPFLGRSQIEKARRETPEAEWPLRFDAAWSGATVDRWLSAWNPALVRAEKLPGDCLGIIALDHGIRPGRQAVALLAYHALSGKFWVLDECAGGNTATSTQQDAENISALLARNNISWEHIDIWVGDRSAAATRYEARKDNGSLRRYLSAHYKVSNDKFPRIDVPYKASGTMRSGFTELNSKFAQGKIIVNPRCVEFIKSCEQWNGDKRSPLKDILDAVRYGVETVLLSTSLPNATLTLQRTR